MTQPRAGLLALGGVLLFWTGVLVAGVLVDGYSAREDYISSLAARGSPVAVLVIGALLASAVAHLGTAWAVLRGWQSRVLASFLFLAATATTTVAVFRTGCPDGPAGCGVNEPQPEDWVDTVHGMSVGLYELFILAAMLTLAVTTLRRARVRSQLVLGLVTVALAVGSVLLIGQTEGDHIGLWQRLWLANNHVWLLVVAAMATRTDPRAT